MVIAIDGPAGAGKSTVARAVAEELGLPYLDSGAMYRCVALAADRAAIDPDEPAAVSDLASELQITFDAERVVLGGEDVTAPIRTPEISALASRVSVHPGVRDAMLGRQRELIERGSFVAEGRDIGTVVSPEAPLKIFLTASDRERARRRSGQTGRPIEEVLADIAERDRRDAEREHGAMRAAADSVEVDTTDLGPNEVVQVIADLARSRGLA